MGDDMRMKLAEWEDIDKHGFTCRLRVFGGWIVRHDNEVVHDTPNGMVGGWDWRSSLCFVPDSNHDWEIEREDK